MLKNEWGRIDLPIYFFAILIGLFLAIRKESSDKSFFCCFVIFMNGKNIGNVRQDCKWFNSKAV